MRPQTESREKKRGKRERSVEAWEKKREDEKFRSGTFKKERGEKGGGEIIRDGRLIG